MSQQLVPKMSDSGRGSESQAKGSRYSKQDLSQELRQKAYVAASSFYNSCPPKLGWQSSYIHEGNHNGISGTLLEINDESKQNLNPDYRLNLSLPSS